MSEHVQNITLNAIQMIMKALKPLKNIADAYDNNNLDDGARKQWGKELEHINSKPPEHIELYSGRGGKTLLTLNDCLFARAVYLELEKLNG